jgi:hypothetical protein
MISIRKPFYALNDFGMGRAKAYAP